MTIPVGDWLLFSMGLFALTEWRIFRFDRWLRALPILWILGFVLENILRIPGPWHWHFSRLLVLVWFAVLAWTRIPDHKVLPIILTSLTLLGQDLFLINEPGMFKYEQWAFAIAVSCIALLSSQSLWGMGLALAGGMLLNLGFSVFLFNGIVRHFDLPDPFLWHFSIVILVGSNAFNQIRGYLKIKMMKPIASVSVSTELVSEEINSLGDQEPTIT